MQQKTVTLPKQLLYVAHDVTCDHVIYRPLRTLVAIQIFMEKFLKLHKNLQRNGILMIVKFKRL